MSPLIAAVVGFGTGVATTLLIRRRPRPSGRASRQQRLQQAYREAANDQAYLDEMAEIDRAFDVTVADGLERPSAARA